jgi:N6-adenosine-specific RNA methylase IME4
MSQPSIVSNLETLVENKIKYRTVYADPPWAYSNRASRGAANNHYTTLDLQQICDEPVADLIAENAHPHLWATNAFLREAFTVIEAWGFQYKSCLVWIKPQLGMGNYWRVSHEFLLLGVRGSASFEDKTCRSWLMNRRTRHSKKPFAFRRLIEKVSPGPYLELYGREEQPRTEWTVYGNQVERRLF